MTRVFWAPLVATCTLLMGGCVPGGGGGGGGDDDDPRNDAAVETDSDVCTPDCTDRVCGSDGCGGICGECPDAQICTAAGACLEVPETCGNDTCDADDGETCETCPADCGACCGDGVCTEAHGEHCGTCPADCGCPEGTECDARAGLCEAVCMPECDGRQCGPDGCGGDCGTCDGDDVCGADGTCAPPPDSCGNDTCDDGEDCANCAADCGCGAGQDCEAGECVDAPRCGDDTCDPGEDCESCAADCGCEAGQNCEGGQCVDAPRCGDDTCNGDEDCDTCAADCACDAGFDCVNAECVCVPDCADAECGDDGCGGVCGQCPDGAACAGGECVFDCPEDCGEPWVAACTGDAFGYRLCTPDPDRPGCTTESRRIPCGEGRQCGGAGECDGVCVKPEVLLLVDRSSSMIGERWNFTRAALQSMAAERTRTARLGLRTFPSQGDGCAAGNVSAPAFDARNVFDRIPDPAQVAQTPIAAAFDDVEAVFGDPDEGESVILITDGDETCEEELAAVDRAEALRRRGIRTYVVGISRQANGDLLSAIARAGGTAPRNGPAYYIVEDGEGLFDALQDIFTRLETCECAEGDRQCAGDNLQLCAEDGFSYVNDLRCDNNCDAAVNACFPICDGTDPTPVCDGDRALACAERGDGFDLLEDCPFGCQDGLGCNPVCRPGELACDGQISQQCVPGGDGFAVVEVCANGCNAATGQCAGAGEVCLPTFDFRCGARGLEVCRADGNGFQLVDECDCDALTATCNPREREGDVRLVGDERFNGRLEIYFQDQWGTVCDDSFGDPDENVACRQLGYPFAVAQLNAAGGMDPIWLDDVACNGDEERLADCANRGIGNHNCGHGEDVGLDCHVPRAGDAFCIDPALSWSYRPGNIVRRLPCRDGCDPETGNCVGDIVDPPDPDGVPLGRNIAFGHHGSCNTFNECGNAQGCAEFACRFNGLGAPVSFEEGLCTDLRVTIPDIDCNLFRNGDANNLDEAWNNSCNIPVAYDVYCTP